MSSLLGARMPDSSTAGSSWNNTRTAVRLKKGPLIGRSSFFKLVCSFGKLGILSAKNSKYSKRAQML